MSVDQSLARRRGRKREEDRSDREKPAVSGSEELEWVKEDCVKCQGAKSGPWGRGGRVIPCPECRGTGSQMTEKPKEK